MKILKTFKKNKELWRGLLSDKPSERTAAWEKALADKYERELCAPRLPEEVAAGRERARQRYLNSK